MNWLDATAAYASGEADWRQQQEQEEEQMAEFVNPYKDKGTSLKAEHIKGRGDVTVRIASWRMGSFDDGDKVFIAFAGKDKQLGLNKTNYNMIADMYGEHPDGWIGKPVTLFATRVTFGEKMVDAIRVRHSGEQAPQQQAPQQMPPSEPDFDDDIPF